MKRRHTASRAAQAWKDRRKRLRLECRECEVICERVVSPWYCLKNSCRYVYVFDDGDTRYFGCLQKVFAPELDLAAFEGSSSRRGAADPYGWLRVNRSPLQECRVTIEQAYQVAAEQITCCNPTFFHHPAAPECEGIRLTAKTSDGPDLDRLE